MHIINDIQDMYIKRWPPFSTMPNLVKDQLLTNLRLGRVTSMYAVVLNYLRGVNENS